MDAHLLACNSHIPQSSHHLVPRDRLAGEIERDIASVRLVLVSAPAGYGKTTLLSQWAQGSQFPIACLSASADLDDFERFFRSLLTAWEAIRPDFVNVRWGFSWAQCRRIAMTFSRLSFPPPARYPATWY